MPMDIQTAIQCAVEGVEKSAPCYGKWAADENGESLSADGTGKLSAYNSAASITYTCIEGSVIYGAYLLGYSWFEACEALAMLDVKVCDNHDMGLFKINDKYGRDVALSYIRELEGVY